MRALLLLFIVVLLSLTLSEFGLEVTATKHRHEDKVYRQMWRQWKHKHNMNHFTRETDETRYFIFKQNAITIDEHNNKPEVTFTMGLNQFSHMTFEEFRQKMFNKPMPISSEFKGTYNENMFQDEPPQSMDWRDHNAVTPIEDQKQCGSCYSFSATGSISGAIAIATGKLITLSKQQIVDCSQSFGNQACNGGLPVNVYEYVMQNGLCSEQDYPYTAVQGTCQTTCQPVVKISNFTELPKNATILERAIGLYGPVSVAIEADTPEFQHYQSGIFSAACGENLDHAVLAIGYGAEGGNDYWIVKNSWGTSWGMDGYIMMSKGVGVDECGIIDMASYPIV